LALTAAIAGETRIKRVTLDKTVKNRTGRPKDLFSENLLSCFVKMFGETDFDRKHYSDLPEKLRRALEGIAQTRPLENQLIVLAQRMADLPVGGGATADEIFKALKKAISAAIAPKAKDENKAGRADGGGNKANEPKENEAGGEEGKKDYSPMADGASGNDENNPTEEDQSAQNEEPGELGETRAETAEEKNKRIMAELTKRAGAATVTIENT
jgi:hypothetical protein